MGFEYRSPVSLWGLPLLHVAFGSDPFSGKRRVARGVLAVGQYAIGVVAVGQVAIGVVALGQVGAGLIGAVAQVAFAWHAVAQFVAGVGVVYGQIATGPRAVGALTWTGPLSVLVVVLAWAACAASLVARGRAQRRGVARLLPDNPISIRDTTPGRVLLRGRVVATRTVDAPVSGRTCVAYDVRRLRLDRAPRAERGCEDFILDDGSGRARVIAADVELILEPSREAERVLASAHVAPASGRPGGGRLPRPPAGPPAMEVCLERVLLPGEQVFVAATAIRSVAGAAVSGDPRTMSASVTRPQVVLHGGAAGPVLVTNREPRELRAETGVSLLIAAAMSFLAAVAPFF